MNFNKHPHSNCLVYFHSIINNLRLSGHNLFLFFVTHSVEKLEVTALEKTLQEKTGELKEMQKQLVDMEREKHTEIVKLRLEVII